MNNKKSKPAFPTKQHMGVETGLTKLEYTVIQLSASLVASNTKADIGDILVLAKKILKVLEEDSNSES